MVINTNLSAMNSARLLASSTNNLSKSLARLSSGSRIVSPEDDAAGLAQSIKFEAQINRNAAANTNVSNAISYSQTQDGFLQKVQKALDRMSELSVLSQDVTKSNFDRSNYTVEFSQLQDYISNVALKEFNGVSLFGAATLGVTIDSDAVTFGMGGVDIMEELNVTIADLLDSSAGTISIADSGAAYSALGEIKDAIQTLSKFRADVGANIERLNFSSEALVILNENLGAANSRIKDVDVAIESAQFARYNILVQSGTAMLAQANLLPQTALRLLQ